MANTATITGSKKNVAFSPLLKPVAVSILDIEEEVTESERSLFKEVHAGVHEGLGFLCQEMSHKRHYHLNEKEAQQLEEESMNIEAILMQ